MKVTLALLADYANVSAEGKLNIMGIFDALYAPAAPVLHPQMRLVVRFQSEPAERGTSKVIEYKLLDADGRVLLAYSQPVVIPNDAPLRLEVPQIATLGLARLRGVGEASGNGRHLLEGHR